MKSATEYDLSGVISGFLDKHLVFPLLEFLAQKHLYDVKQIETSKLDLVEKTNMVDYAVDIYQQLNQTDEVRFAQRESAVSFSMFARALCMVTNALRDNCMECECSFRNLSG